MPDTFTLHTEGPEEWIVWHPTSDDPHRIGTKTSRNEIWGWLNQHNIPRENTFAEGEWWGANGELEDVEFAEEVFDLETTEAQAVEIRMMWF